MSEKMLGGVAAVLVIILGGIALVAFRSMSPAVPTPTPYFGPTSSASATPTPSPHPAAKSAPTYRY